MPEDVKELDERRRALFQEVANLERRMMKVQLAVQELSQLARRHRGERGARGGAGARSRSDPRGLRCARGTSSCGWRSTG